MYIILPSNTGDFSTNSISSFRVRLPNSLSFNGDWEVAITEIQYPVSWRTIKNQEGKIQLTYTHNNLDIPVTIQIQPGYYNTITELLHAVDHAIQTTGDKLPDILYRADLATFRLAMLNFYHKPEFMQWENENHYTFAEIYENPDLVPILPSPPATKALQRRFGDNVDTSDLLRKNPQAENMLSDAVKLTYVHSTQRIHLEWHSKTVKALSFDQSLQFILGFAKETKFKHGITTADYNVDISGSETSFFAYCNIVQPQIVGNSRKQLLRTIPITAGTLGTTVHKEFISPHYVGVLTNVFDTIEIEIRNDYGRLIDFQFGKIIIKLHLRRKTLLNL